MTTPTTADGASQARDLFERIKKAYCLNAGEGAFLVLIAAALQEAEAKGLEEGRHERDVPEITDFIKGVQLEAAHQRERWGMEHDTEKTDAEWFWLVGYLAGKALHLPDKRLHHLVTTAAALANWHYYSAQAAARGGGG